MGQISGVDASLITSIAGVAVANISYVGPTSAATLGLGGGGGKTFGDNPFGGSQDACIYGSSFPTITLYYDSGTNTVYTDSGLTTRFNGQNKFWYNFSDNQSWHIRVSSGIVLGITQC